MKTFFTSDSHFGHTNIIKYCKRPFINAHEMDEALISNWNEVVKPEDSVFHLGDIFFKMRNDAARVLRKRLNGSIYFIIGNHDKTALQVKDCFIWTRDLANLRVEGQQITICHYPMRVWNHSHHGSWHLYGHCHGSLPDDPNSLSFDVGVDCFNYYPIPFEKVHDIMSNKSKKGAGPTKNTGRILEDK